MYESIKLSAHLNSLAWLWLNSAGCLKIVFLSRQTDLTVESAHLPEIWGNSTDGARGWAVPDNPHNINNAGLFTYLDHRKLHSIFEQILTSFINDLHSEVCGALLEWRNSRPAPGSRFAHRQGAPAELHWSDDRARSATPNTALQPGSPHSSPGHPNKYKVTFSR